MVSQTFGLALIVDSLHVTLQFPSRQEVTETVRTRECRVLLKYHGHMLLHVTHQPATYTKHQESQLKTQTKHLMT